MWILLAILAAVPARAGFDLNSAFAELSASAKAAAQKAKKRKIFPLTPAPARPGDISAPLLLDAPLVKLRDASLAAVTVSLGGRDWQVGVVSDAEYDDFHLVLTSGGDRLLSPLSPIGRFLDEAASSSPTRTGRCCASMRA